MKYSINHHLMVHYKDLLIALTRKELFSRYKRAVFGFLWVFLNPLFQMIIIGGIFQYIIKTSFNNQWIFLLIGLLVWNFFILTVNKTTPFFVFERSLIQKAKMHRHLLPFSIVLANSFHFLLGLSLLLPFIGIQGLLSSRIILIIPISIFYILFVLGVGLGLSAANVRYRDIAFFVQAGTQLLFYATPIIYSLEVLPNSLQNILGLNPLSSFVALYRYAILGAPVNWILCWNGLVVALLTAVLGIYFFRKESPYFDDWL